MSEQLAHQYTAADGLDKLRAACSAAGLKTNIGGLDRRTLQDMADDLNRHALQASAPPAHQYTAADGLDKLRAACSAAGLKTNIGGLDRRTLQDMADDLNRHAGSDAFRAACNAANLGRQTLHHITIGQHSDNHADLSTRLRIKYWNHGGTHHTALPAGVTRTSASKVEYLFGRYLTGASKPDVLVVAEMTAKSARCVLERYGYRSVVDEHIEDSASEDQVAVFVRQEIDAIFVAGEARWRAVDVVVANSVVRITGVHLDWKKSKQQCCYQLPELVRHATDSSRYVIIGDFNRTPPRDLEPMFSQKPKSLLQSERRDNLLYDGVCTTVKVSACRELEERSHPVIDAQLHF